MKKLTLFIGSLIILAGLAALPPQRVEAAPAFHTLQTLAASCSINQASGALSNNFFTPWYAYLPKETDSLTGKCRPVLPTRTFGCGREAAECTDVKQSALLIGVAVMELLTKVAGLIAVGYIIFGAVQYMTSQGEAQNLAKAKTSITNALVGFVIIVLAVAFIQFLARAFS